MCVYRSYRGYLDAKREKRRFVCGSGKNNVYRELWKLLFFFLEGVYDSMKAGGRRTFIALLDDKKKTNRELGGSLLERLQ